MSDTFVHESAYVDQPCQIGIGTRIWHFSHIMKNATIGQDCNFGQNVFVASNVVIGNNVKVQNNVSIYEGCVLEDDVFCGPSCVFTNVSNPRSQIDRRSAYEQTILRRGVTLGANCTIVCGITVGRYAFVAAGAVVTKDAPDYALLMGVPARRVGWMSRHGHRLRERDATGNFICPESDWRYAETTPDTLCCLDWPEDQPLPEKGMVE